MVLCGTDACGVDMSGVDVCAVDVCGIYACGVDACGVDTCGVEMCGVEVCVASPQGFCCPALGYKTPYHKKIQTNTTLYKPSVRSIFLLNR